MFTNQVVVVRLRRNGKRVFYRENESRHTVNTVLSNTSRHQHGDGDDVSLDANKSTMNNDVRPTNGARSPYGKNGGGRRKSRTRPAGEPLTGTKPPGFQPPVDPCARKRWPRDVGRAGPTAAVKPNRTGRRKTATAAANGRGEYTSDSGTERNRRDPLPRGERSVIGFVERRRP